MNPILSSEFLIPDSEAHVMPDGRLYIYGSQDKYEPDTWCSHEYRVFSCDNSKLENWVDHGVSFQNHKENGQVPWAKGEKLYAPDAIYKDGKYYLYFCGTRSIEGVATSDRPEGPFTDAKMIQIANGDSIDPAIFVDDDGSAYYFWGQYELRGAKLKEDMCTIEESTLNRCILNCIEHGFFEGSSIRKYNGKYYLVYCDCSRGKPTCLSYAISDTPLGPYKKQGTIIDNIYCDPDTLNNHGSIECFNGQWYVFYHRACNGTKFWRRVCAEPIFFDADGHIAEVEMTSNGASAPLDAFSTIPASCACRLWPRAHIHMELADGKMKEWVVGKYVRSFVLQFIEYKYLNFGNGANRCTITVKGNCTVRLRTSDNRICGSCRSSGDAVQTLTFDIDKISGIAPIAFEFDEGDFEFFDFSFSNK